jgi:hypothetical protein
MGVADCENGLCENGILLFQPAGETGFGAQAVVDDRRWPEITQIMPLLTTNVPDRPFGRLYVTDLPLASRVCKSLNGRVPDTAVPEDGVSQRHCTVQLLPALGFGHHIGYRCGLQHLDACEARRAVWRTPGEGELRVTLCVA